MVSRRGTLTIAVTAAMVVLLGLGTWQLKRLAWKNTLIAKVETRVSKTPVAFEEALQLRRAGDDIEYLPVRVAGVYRHDLERYVDDLFEGKPGWHVYTPLAYSDERYVFVNRGFVPDSLKQASSRGEQSAHTIVATGLVRLPPAETSIFTPENDRVRNQFYWRDFKAMVASIKDIPPTAFAPVFVDEAISVVGDKKRWPRPGVTRVQLANRHLEYAVTWYGLALALAGVYGFLVFGGKRNTAS